MSYIFIIIFAFSFSITSFAHSGRTDSSGGHHDYKNKSGLGSYHYHHGMGAHLHPGGVCPYSGTDSNTETRSYTPPSPSITIKNCPDVLNVGDSAGLEYSVSNATSGNSSITSSDTSVVSVDINNTLKAVGVGTAQITIEASGVTKTFTVKVVAVPVEEIKIVNEIEKIQLGQEYKYGAEIFPQNATNKNVTWSSDNTDILEINDMGQIITKTSGIVTIIVSTDNGIESKTTVEIYEVLPETIECNSPINLIVGDEKEFKVNILPENSNNKDFTLVCDNENLLQYSDNSIKAISEGETILHIKTWNGVEKDIPVKIDIIPVESVNIIDNSKHLVSNIIDKNDNIILDTKISPSNATYQNIEWLSSNNNIVKIENSHIKIVGTGKVTLTCISHEGITNSITFFIIDKNYIFYLILIILIVIVMTIVIKRRKVLNRITNDKKNFENIDSVPNSKEEIISHGMQNSSISQQQTNGDEEQEIRDTINNVKKDLYEIKNIILKETKLGNYKIIENKKCLTFIYQSMFLLQCINKKNDKNSTDNMIDVETVTYHIENAKKYNLYLYAIRKFASKYGLSIYPFFVFIDDSNHKEIINLPYICNHKGKSYKIKAYLKCTIKY